MSQRPAGQAVKREVRPMAVYQRSRRFPDVLASGHTSEADIAFRAMTKDEAIAIARVLDPATIADWLEQAIEIDGAALDVVDALATQTDALIARGIAADEVARLTRGLADLARLCANRAMLVLPVAIHAASAAAKRPTH